MWLNVHSFPKKLLAADWKLNSAKLALCTTALALHHFVSGTVHVIFSPSGVQRIYIYIYYTYILICTPQQCCKAIAQPKADAKTALNSKKRGFGAELMRLDMEFPQHISTSAGSQEDVSKCRCVACMPPRERERGRAG